MLPLRYGYVWLSIGVGLLALVLALALVPTSRISAVLLFSDKTAHLIAFFFLMLWFCGIFRLRLTPWVALGLLCFGLLIEYLQGLLPYRYAEWADAAYDLGGIGLGWVMAAIGLRHWTAFIEAKLFPARNSSI